MAGTDGAVVTVTTEVMDKMGRPRWVVAATFLGAGGHEPRCVDYRARVLPEGCTIREMGRTIRAMESGAVTAIEAEQIGSVPAEGIPRRVFEEASQARLLARARAKVQRRPERHPEATKRLLAREEGPRRGRPPARRLQERLAILAAVETAYRDGRTLAEVATEQGMSRSALRDLLSWARHDADPPLFETYGPGKRGGELTPAARALLGRGA